MKKKKKKSLKNGSDLIDTKLQVRVGKVSAAHERSVLSIKLTSKKYTRFI